MRSMNTNRQIISNSVQNERIYANLDFIRSLPSFSGRGSWRSGIHYLSNHFEDSIQQYGASLRQNLLEILKDWGLLGLVTCKCGLLRR